MRQLVAVLLLFGVFLAGSVDAVACEPLFEEASHAASAADHDDGEKSSPGGENHGLCAHGHCHHGAQFMQAAAGVDVAGFSSSEHPATLTVPLVSSPGDGLKRPPRA